MNTSVINSLFYCLIVAIFWTSFSCNNPASIDTNLVDQDLLDIINEDDFEISSFTIEEDSILTYGPGFVILERYPFGINQDPVFGTSSASITAQYFTVDNTPPIFTGSTVDSVILEMNLNQVEPFYGDTTGVVGIDVFEVAEILDPNTPYFNNFRVSRELAPIGTYEGVPNFRDSVLVNRYRADTLFVDTFPPQIRINLSRSFGEEILFTDQNVLVDPTEFVTIFRGLEFVPTIANEGLIAFDFNAFNTSLNQNISGSNILIYYTQDGEQRLFELAFLEFIGVKIGQQEQDFSGAPIEDFIGDEVMGDSLLFVQGMAGTNAVVRLDDVDRLNGTLINGATLEVYGTALNDDEDLRPVPDQLVLREVLDNGANTLIRDFESSVFAGTISLSGGTPEDMGDGIYKYTFNVGSQLQDIVDGISSNEIHIFINGKIFDMRRVVLFGAGHSTYPIKLNVTYTNL